MDLDDFKDLDQFYDDDDFNEDISEEIVDSTFKKMDRYKDSELIASGGMKDIYKAYDTKSKRYVALAKLREDVPEEQCEDFLNEAYLTASLEHPNIISIYDIGVDKFGSPVFSMELKISDSLAEIL